MEQRKGALIERIHSAFDTPVSNFTEIRGLYIPRITETFCLMVGAVLNLSVVSILGGEAVNAVGMIDPIHQIMQYIYISFGFAATVFVSQNLGAGRPEMAAKSFVQLVRMMLLFSAAASLLLVVFCKPLLQLLYPNANALTHSYARVYYLATLGTGPLYVMASLINGMLRAAGKPRAAMSISLVLNMSWLMLNVLFIRVLHWGIESIAYSVVIARVLTFLYQLRYLVSSTRVMDFCWRKNFRHDGRLCRQILYAAIPYSLEYLFFQSGKLVVQVYAVALGSVAATVNTVGLTLMNALQCAGSSMSDTAATIIGRCMGREDVQNARKYTASFRVATGFVNTIALLVLLAVYRPLIGTFHTTEEIARLVFGNLLIIGLANIVFWPRGFTMETCLKAAGDMHFCTRIATLGMWCIRVGLGYVLSFPVGLGIRGVWIAMAVEWAARGVCFTLRERSSKAFSHHLI